MHIILRGRGLLLGMSALLLGLLGLNLALFLLLRGQTMQTLSTEIVLLLVLLLLAVQLGLLRLRADWRNYRKGSDSDDE